jgi:hypothetical protein
VARRVRRAGGHGADLEPQLGVARAIAALAGECVHDRVGIAVPYGAGTAGGLRVVGEGDVVASWQTAGDGGCR